MVQLILEAAQGASSGLYTDTARLTERCNLPAGAHPCETEGFLFGIDLLFDIGKDSGKRININRQNPEIVANLNAKPNAWEAEMNSYVYDIQIR